MNWYLEDLKSHVSIVLSKAKIMKLEKVSMI